MPEKTGASRHKVQLRSDLTVTCTCKPQCNWKEASLMAISRLPFLNQYSAYKTGPALLLILTWSDFSNLSLKSLADPFMIISATFAVISFIELAGSSFVPAYRIGDGQHCS
jgi:hypothetical protein